MTETDPVACAQAIVGHIFNDPSLLRLALTHASVADSRIQSNERLEFLGDAVLATIVCHELYARFGDWLEGELTKVKSVVVSRRTCAKIADETGLTKLLMLGNGIVGPNALPISVRAAVYEAVIGAIYLDGGLEAVRPFVLRSAAPHLDRCARSQTHDNYKSVLQQYAQRWFDATPQYEALDEQGPDHSKCFEISVVLTGQRFPSAWGPSKKDAEQNAARIALEILQHQNGHMPPLET